MSASPYDEIRNALDEKGAEAALERLSDQLRQEKKYYELFEALKMLARLRLGLPLLYNDLGDELTEEKRNQLEDALIEVCREVGTLLLDEGRIREGWYYLRPVGDKEPVLRAIREADFDEEDTLDDVIEVALHEGVDQELGFGLLLEHHGTCNAITTYEQQFAGLSPAKQQPLAAKLLKHLHEELTATLKADVSHQEGSDPTEPTLAEIIEPRDYLFSTSGYHIDASHLAATVRFARVLDDPELVRLALDLTAYGRRLDPQLQYEQPVPFTDTYPHNALFFQALLGENYDAAMQHFREKAEASDIRREGSLAIETYISLLARTGKASEALDVALRMIPEGVHTMGIAPTLAELSNASGDYEKLATFCQKRDDMLGFITSLLQSKTKS
ncbi:hypothetical protein [Blastopirellula retiformator]|uniref:Uncharacterized protein n=1 Tax=Blastopirellula retiformator TaxID=2527970 RepID=A0A5C5V2K5_9BACT|nr:hypothetical protein [Blastopirellula retiformator]TWT32718.1 hypothetical protein Enr8_25240 [Blastopirellula retiformator]